MKRIIIALAAFMMVCGFCGFASAGDNVADMKGSITLTDTVPRPGTLDISVSQNSYVAYVAGESVPTDGYNICGITSASGKATDDEVLMFAVYGNQAPGQEDDNNVYQKALGTTPVATGDVAWEDPTEANGWVIRGVGSVSTFNRTPPF